MLCYTYPQSSKIGDKSRAFWARQRRKTRVRGGVVQSRGDWAYYKATLNLCGWQGEGPDARVCWKCHADFGSVPFYDASLGALWRRTLVTHVGHMTGALSNDGYISGLFNLPGFKLDFVSADLMHTSDLGCIQYILGNIYWELFVFVGGTRQNPDTALSELLFLIRQCSKELSLRQVPIINLTLGMIRVPIPN